MSDWEDQYQLWLSKMAANNALREKIRKEMNKEMELLAYERKLYYHPLNRLARLLRNIADRIERRTIIP